jgi:hypothetical protein
LVVSNSCSTSSTMRIAAAFLVLALACNIRVAYSDFCPSVGDCCTTHITSGCSNPCLQECVASFQPSCTSNLWNADCVQWADTCLSLNLYLYGAPGSDIHNSQCTATCASSCQQAQVTRCCFTNRYADCYHPL